MGFKNNLKNKIRKLAYGPKASSEDYIAYLRSLGMKIGDRTCIYVPTKSSIDTTRPWMIEIGDAVEITEGVTILTHGYDLAVLKEKYGDLCGSAGHVVIGNNVFIGMNSTILKGVTIGDNVVIGANTLVNRDVPSNSVVVGNPQRVVCDLDTYLAKRKSAQLDEAIDVYDFWRRNSQEGKDGGIPPRSLFRAFFWLFEPRDGMTLSDPEFNFNYVGSDEMDARGLRKFKSTTPQFPSYESFLQFLDERYRTKHS